jgi:hypothetical protein
MFWNSEYNALASLPTLFDVFLRDTQRVRAHPCTQSAATAGLPLSLFLAHIHFLFFAAGCSSGRQPPHQQRAAACKFTRGQSAQVSHSIRPVSLALTLLWFIRVDAKLQCIQQS